MVPTPCLIPFSQQPSNLSPFGNTIEPTPLGKSLTKSPVNMDPSGYLRVPQPFLWFSLYSSSYLPPLIMMYFPIPSRLVKFRVLKVSNIVPLIRYDPPGSVSFVLIDPSFKDPSLFIDHDSFSLNFDLSLPWCLLAKKVFYFSTLRIRYLNNALSDSIPLTNTCIRRWVKLIEIEWPQFFP